MVAGEKFLLCKRSQKKTVKKGFNWHICIQTHTEW